AADTCQRDRHQSCNGSLGPGSRALSRASGRQRCQHHLSGHFSTTRPPNMRLGSCCEAFQTSSGPWSPWSAVQVRYYRLPGLSRRPISTAAAYHSGGLYRFVAALTGRNACHRVNAALPTWPFWPSVSRGRRKWWGRQASSVVPSPCTHGFRHRQAFTGMI
ncbi:hypothetical protein IQ07DRAFT_660417, partial [Pyrenochaeta sp. DS3sAY3a]